MTAKRKRATTAEEKIKTETKEKRETTRTA